MCSVVHVFLFVKSGREGVLFSLRDLNCEDPPLCVSPPAGGEIGIGSLSVGGGEIVARKAWIRNSGSIPSYLMRIRILPVPQSQPFSRLRTSAQRPSSPRRAKIRSCRPGFPILGVFRLKGQSKRDGSIIVRSCKASLSPVYPIRDAIPAVNHASCPSLSSSGPPPMG